MSHERIGPAPLQHKLAQILIENADLDEPRGTEDFLRLVTSAAAVRAEADNLLRTAVVSAREAGATWQIIGSTLGMTKQAAQKRFAPPANSPQVERDANERILGPVTSVDEMRELELAGRYGWHSVEFGPFYHRVLCSSTQWKHRRVTISPGKVRSLVAAGWLLVGSSFPYTYLKRDTGIPALLEGPNQQL